MSSRDLLVLGDREGRTMSDVALVRPEEGQQEATTPVRTRDPPSGLFRLFFFFFFNMKQR